MDRYIGLDVHAASTTMAVVGPSGRRIGTQVLETNGRAIIAALKTVPGTKHLCFEEGTQAEWLAEVLKPYVDELVVTRGAANRGTKNDAVDAFELAEKLRTGQLKTRIYKDAGPARRLRELARLHTMLTGDVVRTKNRIKGLFRSRGVQVDDEIYCVDVRSAWLKKLPSEKRWAATLLCAELDAQVELKKKAEVELLDEAAKHRAATLLRTCPGLGPIRAAQLIAIVVTPTRFRTKRQLWAYCGLGVVTRSSADWVKDRRGQWQRVTTQQTRGLNRNFNRPAKNILKGAATTAIASPDSPLGLEFRRLIDNGTKPNLAKLTIARRIAAIALSLWKHNEEFDSKRLKIDSRLAS
jgi:transposase